MGVITQPHVAYTISDEKFAAIRKRIGTLRRSKLPRLQALATAFEPEQVFTNKGSAIFTIIIGEFGPIAHMAYLARMAQEKTPRRRRSQYALGL
jgi:hypothetical protein